MIYKLSITLSKIRSIRKKKKTCISILSSQEKLTRIREQSILLARLSLPPRFHALKEIHQPLVPRYRALLDTHLRTTHKWKAKETRRRTGRRSSSRAQAENRHRKWNERGKSQRGLEERRWRLQAWPSGG